MAVYDPNPDVTKTFVLCFDGTGNKFHADSSDSNVLKIFRMLDRTQRNQFHYYQPGIGTYVTSSDVSDTGFFAKLEASYLKAKDSAIGTSFADHVLGGYKFLMRYYCPGDDIYFFGFSRGSYIARFLAEMLDFVGLLGTGNEELIQFAWKTFAKWKQRKGETKEDKVRKEEIFHFMKGFRETFSRPVKPIRFLGLFDTVNSVPRFESAWMQRSKFPYTARSSARVMRHAVSIDERRAKFRQDLISEIRPSDASRRHRTFVERCRDWHRHHGIHLKKKAEAEEAAAEQDNPTIIVTNGSNDNNEKGKNGTNGTAKTKQYRRADDVHRYRDPHHRRHRRRSNAHIASPASHQLTTRAGRGDVASDTMSQSSSLHLPGGTQQLDRGYASYEEYESDDDDAPQDIDEVWFPGGHADIGGGWHLQPDEEWPLSHAPLVWMVHEAQKAGLPFDEEKLRQFACAPDDPEDIAYFEDSFPTQPVQVEHGEASIPTTNGKNGTETQQPQSQSRAESQSQFHAALHVSSTKGKLHDCLMFDNGVGALGVILWRVMEHLPFRRMDLQKDGSWKPIRWPLPRGEVRDIPDAARIHHSAIRRLRHDPNYRPGNLILGGGGRGVRIAPEDKGIGEWQVFDNEGHPVLETFVRKNGTMTGAATNGTNGKSKTNGTNGTNKTNGKDKTNGTNGTHKTNGKSKTNGTNGTNGVTNGLSEKNGQPSTA